MSPIITAAHHSWAAPTTCFVHLTVDVRFHAAPEPVRFKQLDSSINLGTPFHIISFMSGSSTTTGPRCLTPLLGPQPRIREIIGDLYIPNSIPKSNPLSDNGNGYLVRAQDGQQRRKKPDRLKGA